VAYSVSSRWIRHIWVFEGAEKQFIVHLSLHLRPVVFAPREQAPLGFMYIINRGIALYCGHMLSSGRVWGDDLLLHSAHLRLGHAARALHFLEVYMVDGNDLDNSLKSFPVTAKIVRRRTIRWAVRREFVRKANELIKLRTYATVASAERKSALLSAGQEGSIADEGEIEGNPSSLSEALEQVSLAGSAADNALQGELMQRNDVYYLGGSGGGRITGTPGGRSTEVQNLQKMTSDLNDGIEEKTARIRGEVDRQNLVLEHHSAQLDSLTIMVKALLEGQRQLSHQLEPSSTLPTRAEADVSQIALRTSATDDGKQRSPQSAKARFPAFRR